MSVAALTATVLTATAMLCLFLEWIYRLRLETAQLRLRVESLEHYITRIPDGPSSYSCQCCHRLDLLMPLSVRRVEKINPKSTRKIHSSHSTALPKIDYPVAGLMLPEDALKMLEILSDSLKEDKVEPDAMGHARPTSTAGQAMAGQASSRKGDAHKTQRPPLRRALSEVMSKSAHGVARTCPRRLSHPTQ